MIGLIAPFQILDHLDRLNIVRETSIEYHCTCPVCGDGGFKVNKKNGKYQAFKCDCSTKEIREAIRPWSEVKESQSPNSNKKRDSPADGIPSAGDCRKKSIKPKSEIKLARLNVAACDSPVQESKAIPNWLQKQGVPQEAIETRYWYSKTQWVSRFEWINSDGIKEKTIRQGHVKSNGLVQWKKGSKEWRAYRLSEAVKHCHNQWVLGVEGEECVETARKKALSAITWQGSNWEEKSIASDLTKLKESGAKGLVYFPDHDEAGEKKAELVKRACQEVNLSCLVLSPTEVWSKMPEKGDITDWVEAHPQFSTNELVEKLESAIFKAAARQKKEKINKEESERLANLPNWSQSDIGFWLAERYRSQLAWNTELQEWYRYSSVIEGIWSVEPVEFVGQLVKSEVERLADSIAQSSKKKPSFTVSFVNGVMALLKMDLAVRKWDEAEGCVPLLNGVLDLKTKKLTPHAPGNRLRWCLPYNYEMLATCDPIKEWLLEMCNGDQNLVQLMRAYLLGVVTGRTDWQKFLELVGAGGTGKSTFTRLAIALVGANNTHTTTLKKLEGERFETASIAGKRMLLINDSERFAASVSTLKALTGQDTLPFEVKFKQSSGGFNPNALVIVTTNEVIQSSDYTSGLERRRISIPMFNRIRSDRQRNLIEHRNGEIYGEFVPYIPGLLNWVLEMDGEEATRIVKNYETAVPSLAAMKASTLVETNPIADWLDNFVVYDASAKTNIGVAKRDKDSNSATWYLNTDIWLYANYKEYCQNSGTHPVSLRRFVNLLSDLVKNQLSLDINKKRDCAPRSGRANRFGSYFEGLKIRSEIDKQPPMITGNPSLEIKTSPVASNTNVINKLWTMVMDKVTDVIEYVMAESIAGDRCDDSDGKNKKLSENNNGREIKVKCNMPDEVQLEKNNSVEEFSILPSPSSQEKSQSQTVLDVTDTLAHPSSAIKSPITVGDKVTISDCPGHWSWASPFTVERIEGEMVKLEMIEELVEMSLLEKWSK
ncbi:phage/plasmid primase, P4 family [Pleurocapsa sp. PCC 7319]|uniref:DNA primase family protein n=1 Tax=Pleurocapsa sp. PCC 7319 TaxID=118161 RepID=UPI00034557E3|nr:phage/plasmid primase, P4 family [Pleurocapsa sp. PCC 7319]